MCSSGATYRPPTCPMIQLLGSFWGQPASAMKPGTLAVDGTPYTPDRSARRSRMPVAASALESGFGVWASFGAAESIASSAPQMASSFKFILTPCFLTGLMRFPDLEQAGIAEKPILPRIRCQEVAEPLSRHGARGFGRTWTL